MPASKPTESHSFFKFWKTAIVEGAKKSWETGFGKAIEIAGLCLGLGLLEVRHLQNTRKNFDVSNGEEFVNFWVAILPIFALAAWFLFHVFRQPYEIYKDQFEKHEAEIAEKESIITQMLGQFKEMQEKLAEKSAADKLVERRNDAKELLGYRLLALESRLYEARQISRLQFKDEVKQTEWKKTQGVLDQTEEVLKKHLTMAEASLFIVTTGESVPEINDDPYFEESRRNWQWHVNVIKARRDKLINIIERLG